MLNETFSVIFKHRVDAAVQIASYYIVIGNLDNFPLIPTHKRGEKKEKVVY